MENKDNDLTEIITQTLNKMNMELGDSFDIDKVNLAELERRTGITRAMLRRIKSNGFVDKPHGISGHKAGHTVLSRYTAVIDNLLSNNCSELCQGEFCPFDRSFEWRYSCMNQFQVHDAVISSDIAP